MAKGRNGLLIIVNNGKIKCTINERCSKKRAKERERETKEKKPPLQKARKDTSIGELQ